MLFSERKRLPRPITETGQGLHYNKRIDNNKTLIQNKEGAKPCVC